MGELTNLNPRGAITDADIPASIARDSKTAAAIAAHEAKVDPHPQYLIAKRKIITVMSGTGQGAVTSLVHELNQTLIIGFRAMMRIDLSIGAGFTPLILPGGLSGLTGYNYSAHLDSGSCIVRLHPTDSRWLILKAVTFIIDHV